MKTRKPAARFPVRKQASKQLTSRDNGVPSIEPRSAASLRIHSPAIRPVVTICWYPSAPSEPPYKLAMSLQKEEAGWAVEVLNHPAGGIAIPEFYGDEAAAWQQASRIAVHHGWRAERDRGIALQAARSVVAEARP